MGSAAQLYKLGWSDLGQSLKKTVSGLRSHGELFDVTLAAEGKTFAAHKIVLSASSPLLLNLLKVAPCKHPVILLPGVTAADVEFLLDFIYTGEVSVYSDRLPSLFQAARFLDIQGLAQGEVSTQVTLSRHGETLTADSLGTQDKDRDSRGSKRPKRKCTSNADMSDSEEKWARWETSPNAETLQQQSVEAEVDRRGLESDPTYQAQSSNKQGSEAAVTLATLQNVVPRPGWSKMQVNSRSVTAMSDEGDSLVEMPAHILHDAGCDSGEHGNDETYSAIAAAADAAAVAAATLSDKKGSSEQPVACPLCNFIIKQSRNLRRHLEIKHFGGARSKKSKGKTKTAPKKDGGNDTDTECGADPSVIDHVQVEIKSPSASDTNSASITGLTSPVDVRTDQKGAHSQAYAQSPLQQYAHVGPALLSHQMVAPSAAGYAHTQHIQLLKSPLGNPHPVLAATVAQSGAHFLGLYGTDNIRPPSHQ